jgi:hypothetical protein
MNNEHPTLHELKRNVLAALAVITIVNHRRNELHGAVMTRTQSRSKL